MCGRKLFGERFGQPSEFAKRGCETHNFRELTLSNRLLANLAKFLPKAAVFERCRTSHVGQDLGDKSGCPTTRKRQYLSSVLLLSLPNFDTNSEPWLFSVSRTMILGAVASIVLATTASVTPQFDLGLLDGRLRSCPVSADCVSSSSREAPNRALAPLSLSLIHI